MWDALIDLYLLLACLMLVLAKDCSSNTITHKMELTSGTLMYKIRHTSSAITRGKIASKIQ